MKAARYISSADHRRARSIAKEDAGSAISIVHIHGELFYADHQHMLCCAADGKLMSNRKLVEEATARSLQIEGAACGAKLCLHNAAHAGEVIIRADSRNNNQAQVFAFNPRHLERLACRCQPHCRSC